MNNITDFNPSIAIKSYILWEIGQAKPSDGWTMRRLQALGVGEYFFVDKEYVQSEVKRVVLEYCNQ